MPIIKLNSHGFHEYTGLLGGLEFVDGVSVDSVSRRDADRLGAICEVIDLDTGKQANVSQTIDEALRSEKVEPEPEPEPESEPEVEPESESEPLKVYTEAELSVIASEQGISGLREIAEPLGVKGTSIRALIPKILSAQPDS